MCSGTIRSNGKFVEVTKLKIGEFMKTLIIALLMMASAVEAKQIQQIPPAGYIRLCISHPDFCPKESDISAPEERVFTNEITGVNVTMNRSIVPTVEKLDGTEEWHLAEVANPKGNCNTFALTKREALHQIGWSYHNLILTVAQLPETGEYHLILVVKTTNGDFILDNMTNEILPLSRTKYRIVMMQDSKQPFKWYGDAK
jgi:predicted transglutaminase-like cysteine proteinase